MRALASPANSLISIQGRRTQTENQEHNHYQTEAIAPERDKSQVVSQMRNNSHSSRLREAKAKASGREKRKPKQSTAVESATVH
jgi:hypothetical protein